MIGGKMQTQKLTIHGIPAIIWGKNSPKVFIAVLRWIENQIIV